MTKIDVINRALFKLGEPMITSLNGMAKSYETIFEDVKSLLLSAYPWRFAVTRQSMPKYEERFGTKVMYRLPNDCLLLLHVFGMTDERKPPVQGYEVADNCIVTSVKNGVTVEYVRNIEEIEKMSPLFKEAMAAKIAAELVMRIKHTLSLKQMLDDEFFYLIRQAELNNEIIKDAELMPENSWVLIREVWD